MENNCEDGGNCEKKKSACRDIRRYYCEYCGICRSKKALIRSHILANHKDKVKEESDVGNDSEENKIVRHTCPDCGASFRKPAYLKQHMLSHSTEKSFCCPLDDCDANYRRKDHLTRHMLKHEGKSFTCPVENCKRDFGIQGNMTRHVREIHGDNLQPKVQKQYVCQEVGCGKEFKYHSKLIKHEDSHVKLEFVEVVCCEPNCMKAFTNEECLKAHVRSCHQHVVCEICGSKQLKKNFKRHELSHGVDEVTERIKCSYEGCDSTFSNGSNLKQHIKAVHQELRPFICRFSGCGKMFPYKHVRDNHEKSGLHNYVSSDFLEADELLQSRPKGGRKRKCFTVETLQRKRVVPPGQDSALDNGTEYLRWLLSDEQV